MLDAVIIGGHVQGLGLMRALGTMGVDTGLIDSTPYNISRYSRFCSKFMKLPKEAMESESSFQRHLNNLALKNHLSNCVIFPTDDQAVFYLSRCKEELEGSYIVPVPEWEIVKHFYDKKLTYRLAERRKIPIPRTFYPSDKGDLREIASSFDFPLILKPSVMHKFHNKTGKKVFVAHDCQELTDYYSKASSIIDPSEIIIQEIIPGSPDNLFSFGSFFKGEKAQSYIFGRRSRQIPMNFGKASTLVELCDIPEIYDSCIDLLKSIDYYGLSEIEFKRDPRDGIYKLLEVNPRSWKWHSLAMLAGCNLPYMLYCDQRQEKSPTSDRLSINPKGKWIDLYTDLYVSFCELARGNLSLSEYVRSLRGTKILSVFSMEDPLPFLAETILLPYTLIRRW